MTFGHFTESGIHYLKRGDGEAIVFVHGAGGNAVSWFQQIDAFAQTHLVICIDLPGFGKSSAISAPLENSTLSRCIIDVIDHAGIETAHLVCQSLGGWFGLRAALDFPQRIKSLVLSCTMAGIVHPPAMQAFSKAQERMGPSGPASLALSDDFIVQSPSLSYLYGQISAFNPPLEPSTGHELFAPHILIAPEKLTELQCPVFQISGELDPIWPPESLVGLVSAARSSRSVTIYGTGHSPYFETPGSFNSAVRGWLETDHAI